MTFLFPVGLAVLDDAEGVDPEVADLEISANGDGVEHDGGELAGQNLVGETCDVGGQKLGLVDGVFGWTPAVAEGCVTDAAGGTSTCCYEEADDILSGLTDVKKTGRDERCRM